MTEREHPDVWRVPKPVIRDEIHTDNVEYAMALDRSYREHGQIPHAGYMWRVTQIDRVDHSQTINYGGMWEDGPKPGLYRVPGPMTFVFLLERDA